MASTTTTTIANGSVADDASRRQEAVAAETRALLEAAVRSIVEGWRAEAQAEGRPFDPSEDVLVVLSGGVDSSLTFHLASSLYGVRRCMTLLADGGTAATDAPWCRAVAGYVERETLVPRGLALEHEVSGWFWSVWWW